MSPAQEKRGILGRQLGRRAPSKTDEETIRNHKKSVEQRNIRYSHLNFVGSSQKRYEESQLRKVERAVG